jgi:hypothetical protein
MADPVVTQKSSEPAIHTTPAVLTVTQREQAADKLEAIIKDFGTNVGKSEGSDPKAGEKTADNLRKFLKETPEAREALLTAIANGNLTKIVPLDPNANADASYNPDNTVMALSVARINSAESAPDKLRLNQNITHETQHAHNRVKALSVINAVDKEIESIASNRTNVDHDYTHALATRKNAFRENEASAEIASYNTAVSVYARTTGNDKPTAQQLYEFDSDRMSTFIKKEDGPPVSFNFKSEYEFSPNRTLDPNKPKNLEAAAVNYYDVPGNQGLRGNQDYTHSNLRGTIEKIADLENEYRKNENGKSPTISIDMKSLRLDKDIVEDYYVSNTKPKQSLNFIDTSNGGKQSVKIEELSDEMRLDRMITAYGKASNSPTAERNLRDLFNSSPNLKADYLTAIKGNEFRGFTVDKNNGSEFDTQKLTVSLPLSVLENAGNNKTARAELAYALGRNNQIAYEYLPSNDKSFTVLTNSIASIASNNTKQPSGASTPHDYTATIQEYLNKDRDITGRANILAFNTVVDQVSKDKPNPTLKDIYESSPPPNGKMGGFIIKDESQTPPYKLRDGLQVNQNMKLVIKNADDTPSNNVKIVGDYFHNTPSSPGLATPKTKAAETAIRLISVAENANGSTAEVKINMAKLGLNEVAVEQSLRTGTPVLRYTDTSNGQNKPSDFTPFSPSPVTPGYQAPQIAGKPTDLQNPSRAETAQNNTSNGKLMQSDQLVSARTGTDQSPTKPFIDQPFQTSTGSTSAIKPMLNTEAVTSPSIEPTKPFVNQQHANLYQQAFDLLGKNPSQFGITNVQAHETAAYNLSSKSLGEGLNKIDTIVASTKNNGDLFAVQTGQSQEFNQRAHVEAKSLQQPIGQNVALLQQQVEQQSQTLAQQPKVNAPSMA